MSTILGDLIARVRADVGDFETGMTKVSKSLNTLDRETARMTGGFDKLIDNLSSVGMKMSAAITLPLAGAGAVITKFAADFELGMRQVTSLMGNVSEKQFRELSDATLELSKRMGIDATGAAHALYEAISAGVPKENAIQFLEVASKAAIAGVTDTKVAVDGLTSVMNAYHLEASKTAEVSDAMFQAVNVGKFTFGELAASIAQVTPLSAQLGISFKDVMAAGATLTTRGQSIGEAFDGIRSAMKALIDPSKQMKDLLAQIGFTSGEALLKSQGLHGAFQSLYNAAKGNTEILAQAIGRVEGLGAVLALTGQNADDAAKHLNTVRNSAGAAALAFDQIEKSASRQFARLVNDLKGTAIELGTALLPAVNGLLQAVKPLANGLAGIVDWFVKLPGPVQAAALGIAAFAAALGPIALGAAGLISAFTGMVGALKFFSGAIPAVALAVSELVPRMVALSAAVGSFAVQTLPAAITAMATWARTGWAEVGAAITRFATVQIPAAISAVATFATTAIPQAISSVTTLATTSIPSLVASLRNLSFASVTSTVSGFGASLKALVAGAIPALVSSLSVLGVALAGAAGAFAAFKIGEAAYQYWQATKDLKNASSETEKAIVSLSKYLASQGVVIERGKMSLDEWLSALQKAAIEVGKTKAAVQGSGDAFAGLNAQQKILAESYVKLGMSAAEAKKAVLALADPVKSAGDAAEKAGKQFREAGRDWKEMGATSAVLAEEWRQMEKAQTDLERSIARHNIQIAETIRSYQQLEGFGGSVDFLTASWARLTVEFDKVAPEIDEIVRQTTKLSDIKAPGDFWSPLTDGLKRTKDALDSIGGESSEALRGAVDKARANWEEMVRLYGEGSHNALVALRNWYQAQKDEALKSGQEWSRANQQTLETLEKQTGGHIEKQKEAWGKLGQQISTIFTDLSKSITDLIFQGGKFGDIMVGVAKDIGKAITRYIIEEAMNSFISKIKEAGGLWKALFDMSGPNYGVKVPTPPTPQAPMPTPGGTAPMPTTPSVPGGTTTSGGWGLNTGTVDAISSAVTAIGSVLQYLQGRRMEQDIGRIEVTSRGILNEHLNLRADEWDRETHLMAKLDDIWSSVMHVDQSTYEMLRIMQGGGPSWGENEGKKQAERDRQKAEKELTDAMEKVGQQTENLTAELDDAGNEIVYADRANTAAISDLSVTFDGASAEITQSVDDLGAVVQDASAAIVTASNRTWATLTSMPFMGTMPTYEDYLKSIPEYQLHYGDVMKEMGEKIAKSWENPFPGLPYPWRSMAASPMHILTREEWEARVPPNAKWYYPTYPSPGQGMPIPPEGWYTPHPSSGGGQTVFHFEGAQFVNTTREQVMSWMSEAIGA